MTPTQRELFVFDKERCQKQIADLRRLLDTSERERARLEILLQERDRKIEKLTAHIEKIMSVFGDVGDPLR